MTYVEIVACAEISRQNYAPVHKGLIMVIELSGVLVFEDVIKIIKRVAPITCNHSFDFNLKLHNTNGPIA